MNNKFDEDQLKCINFSSEKPLVVLAGPGSGKTRTLIGRIIKFLNSGIPANEILALTFSRKASIEVQSRIMKELGFLSNISQLTIRTFHSLCMRILRDNCSRVKGLNKKFIIVTSKQQRLIIRKLLKSEDPEKEVPNETVSKYVNLIAKVKCLGEIEMYPEMEEFIPKYNNELRLKNGVDFTDLIILTNELFEEHKDVLDTYRDRYKYVFCDEFQDLNYIQYSLLHKLTKESKRVTVVGDEDQSIYGFRGGTSELFKKFQEDFPESKKIILEKNYRSSKIIVNNCKLVIDRNNNRTKKNLDGQKTNSKKIRVFLFNTDTQEADFIAKEIIRLSKRGLKYKEMAVLCRQRKNILKLFEEKFKEKKIPLQKSGKKGINERLVSSTILSYLALVVNEKDDEAFKAIYNVPGRKLGKSFFKYLEEMREEFEEGSQGSVCYYKTAKKLVKEKIFPKTRSGTRAPNKTAKENLTQFIKLIHKFRSEQRKMDLNKFISHVVTKIDIESEMKKRKKKEQTTRNFEKMDIKRAGKTIGQTDLEDDEDFDFNFNLQENLFAIQKLVKVFRKEKKLEQMESENEESHKKELRDFIDYIRTLQKEDENLDGEKDALFCSTIHQAKGLEWKYVYVVRVNEGICPSKVGKTEKDFEEERRLFYVACSRAMDGLTISCLHNTEKLYPSNFLRDIDPRDCILKKGEGYVDPGEDRSFILGERFLKVNNIDLSKQRPPQNFANGRQNPNLNRNINGNVQNFNGNRNNIVKNTRKNDGVIDNQKSLFPVNANRNNQFPSQRNPQLNRNNRGQNFEKSFNNNYNNGNFNGTQNNNQRRAVDTKIRKSNNFTPFQGNNSNNNGNPAQNGARFRGNYNNNGRNINNNNQFAPAKTQHTKIGNYPVNKSTTNVNNSRGNNNLINNNIVMSGNNLRVSTTNRMNNSRVKIDNTEKKKGVSNNFDEQFKQFESESKGENGNEKNEEGGKSVSSQNSTTSSFVFKPINSSFGGLEKNQTNQQNNFNSNISRKRTIQNSASSSQFIDVSRSQQKRVPNNIIPSQKNRLPNNNRVPNNNIIIPSQNIRNANRSSQSNFDRKMNQNTFSENPKPDENKSGLFSFRPINLSNINGNSSGRIEGNKNIMGIKQSQASQNNGQPFFTNGNDRNKNKLIGQSNISSIQSNILRREPIPVINERKTISEKIKELHSQPPISIDPNQEINNQEIISQTSVFIEKSDGKEKKVSSFENFLKTQTMSQFSSKSDDPPSLFSQKSDSSNSSKGNSQLYDLFGTQKREKKVSQQNVTDVKSLDGLFGKKEDEGFATKRKLDYFDDHVDSEVKKRKYFF